MKILLGALGAALATIVGALAWLGALSPIEVAERDMGPYLFVYVQDPSSEHDKVDALSDALARRLDAAGITARKRAQEFYPTGRGIQNQIGFMVQQDVPRDVLGPETFLRPIAVQRYMVVEVPYRNHLSFLVGHWRAGPAFEKHIARHKYAETSAMVILDGDRILYLAPIATA